MTIAGEMQRFRLEEVSLVDAGAQVPAKAVIAKREDPDWDDVIKRTFSAERRKELAESGAAMPSGAYPIESSQDLKNAIEAFGRARDPAATKAHIRARAKALGAEDMLPDSWKAEPKTEAAPESADDENEVDKAIRAEIAKGAAIRKAAGERFETNSGAKAPQNPVATPIAVGPNAPGSPDLDADADYAMPAWSAGDDWLTRATKARDELEVRTRRIAARENLSHAKAADRLMRTRAGEALVTAMS